LAQIEPPLQTENPVITMPGIDSVADRISGMLEKLSIGARINNKLISQKNKQAKAIDTYVIAKCIIAAIILFTGISTTDYGLLKIFLIILAIYSIVETMLSLFRKIFYPDGTRNPSHRRASLLLLFNWMEIIIWYAVLYVLSESIAFKEDAGMFDYFYFSFLHGATMDMDGAVVIGIGRIISICQITTFVVFIALFFSHNFGKI
jgi:hypothetical protein